jgi:hypothetical protein
MALGGQSRFYYPYPRAATFEQVHANFDHVQSRYDRTPVFEPQVYNGVGPVTTISSTAGGYTALTTLRIDAPRVYPSVFYKEESWTAVLFHLNITSYHNPSGMSYFNVLFNGIAYSGGIGGSHPPAINAHRLTTGVNKIETMPSGKHSVQIAWGTGGGTHIMDANDFWSLSVTEVLPTTKFT